jgi:hypothetical protein
LFSFIFWGVALATYVVFFDVVVQFLVKRFESFQQTLPVVGDVNSGVIVSFQQSFLSSFSWYNISDLFVLINYS